LPFVRGKGFTPLNQVVYNEVNLDQLTSFPAGTEITPESLMEARLLRDPRKPTKILGRGELQTALTVRVHKVTKSAAEKIAAAGGRVETLES
jgi:large subunit ribosomal protein L15